MVARRSIVASAVAGRRTPAAVAMAVVAVVISLVALAIGSRTASAAPTSSTGVIVGVYGKCMDVRGGFSADGTPVQTYSCNGQDNQQWRLTSYRTGDTLSSLGKCLDVQNSGGRNALVQLYTCNGSGAQAWFWIPAYGGELVNPQSGYCLDAPGDRAGGSQLKLYDCSKAASESWQLPL